MICIPEAYNRVFLETQANLGFLFKELGLYVGMVLTEKQKYLIYSKDKENIPYSSDQAHMTD